MNAKAKHELNKLAKQVSAHCHALRMDTESPDQWRKFLEYAVKESRALEEPPIEHAPESTKQWQKSCAIIDWCHKHKILLRKSSVWRWIDSDEIPGMIWALPTIHGIPRITDGIYVYIEREDGTVFKGHLDWFIKDLIPKSVSNKTKTNTKQTKKQELQFAELFLN